MRSPNHLLLYHGGFPHFPRQNRSFLSTPKGANQYHRFNRWFSPPLTGAVTGLAPIRGTEFYDCIIRTAGQVSLFCRFTPFLFAACMKLAAFYRSSALFPSPVEPGVYFHVLRHQLAQLTIEKTPLSADFSFSF